MRRIRRLEDRVCRWMALASALAAVLAVAAPVDAQGPTQPANQVSDPVTLAEAKLEPQKDEVRSRKRQAERDPLVRSGLTLPEPQLTFETTKGKGRATGTIGFVTQQSGGEASVVVGISAPIGTSEDADSRPLDLRGVSDGASVTVGFTGARMFRTFSVSDLRKLCGDIPKEECTAGKLEDQNSALSRQLLNAVFRQVPMLFGATVTYGRNTFRFVDNTGARQDPLRRSDLQIEGDVGFLVNRRTNLLAIHVAYSDTYAASPDRTQLCRPLPDSVVTRCDAAIIGGPLADRSIITTAEYRWQLPGEQKFPVTIAPKFQFSVGVDGADDLTSFEVPVYFFQEKADARATATAPKLNGGVSAGWRSDTGFQAYVFIGTTFRLLKI